MGDHIVDPNLLAVIQSLKPYMSSRALQCTELAETLLEVLASEEARRVQEKLRNLRAEYKQTIQVSGLQKKEFRKNDK
ncbi:hypothetical protein [Neomoorella thermoacetica]|uniref:Uncharacterized protein n=2 Tax=Neomoorella thermoacetica TaxID=1525 RepID=A0AAC9HFD6_NEOTH|nr:hypothetical protein [Moorella thermoacetica]AKX95584.1 hypothetical protein MOTHA_c02140 [Moorella thermoacetica]AOQ22700.1 hypothetical protein Maut_00217 [Moorella thermoacetica]OIQ53317.1 hypothetical protein MORE_20440 [Moorella thermoacetica]OIQ53705.1 hypothetical protein MOCA_24760 [Moorella thermoacetica]OIQ58953.1 hypothetical protein MTIN_25200 [Moorella thermoacetica]